MHEEVMICAQSLNRPLSFVQRGREYLISCHAAKTIYDGWKEMKMFGAYVNSQPRPE
jgi:hypothetical protein